MIHIVSSDTCPYCTAAKQLLSSLGYEYIEKTVDLGSSELMEIMQITGQRTVPQIFAGEISKKNLIGGYSEISQLQSAGRLEALLSNV